jgi:hypothetical protein
VTEYILVQEMSPMKRGARPLFVSYDFLHSNISSSAPCDGLKNPFDVEEPHIPSSWYTLPPYPTPQTESSQSSSPSPTQDQHMSVQNFGPSPTNSTSCSAWQSNPSTNPAPCFTWSGLSRLTLVDRQSSSMSLHYTYNTL